MWSGEGEILILFVVSFFFFRSVADAGKDGCVHGGQGGGGDGVRTGKRHLGGYVRLTAGEIDVTVYHITSGVFERVAALAFFEVALPCCSVCLSRALEGRGCCVVWRCVWGARWGAADLRLVSVE